MAEGILKHKLAGLEQKLNVKVESRGVRVPIAGLKADPRAVRVSQQRGVDLRKMRTRQLKLKELMRADYVLVMSERHLQVLGEMCDGEKPSNASIITVFSPAGLSDQEVPDPYYSNDQGFSAVFDLLSASLDGFISHLQMQK